MRLSNSAAVSRPLPYDRAGSAPKTLYNVSGSAAPHAAVTRWTYTVPAGKSAFFDLVYGYVQRVTAAATVGVASALFDYTPVGGVATRVAQTFLITNGLNDVQQNTLSQFGIMEAGDVISTTDSDGSTGGTITYVESVKYTEFPQ